jgi:hypothetical protein
MLSYNVNQVLNTNQQNTKVKGDRLGLSSVNTQLLINSAGLNWHKHHNFNADTISDIISCHCRNLLAAQFLPKKKNDGKNG